MVGKPKTLALVCQLCMSIGLATAAVAQSYDPAWLEDLERQLAVDLECKVSEFVSIHDGDIGGRNMNIARVKCADGRMFDAHRLEPQENFAIKACEIVAC